MIALLLLAGLLLLDRSHVFSPRLPPDDDDDDDDDDAQGAASSLPEPPPRSPGVALVREPQPAPTVAGALLDEPPTAEPAAPDGQPLRPQPLRPPARVSSSSAAAGSASKCGTAQLPALRPLFGGPPARCAPTGGNAGADDARHRCACGRSGLVVVRAEATGRYLTAFWGGGEVFAIGALDRMPLRRMTFRMEPVGGGGGGGAPSPWVTLRHLESGGELAVLPKSAPQGGFMLLARQGHTPASASASASAASGRFCAEAHSALQSAPLAVPQLGSCASSGRTWRLWAARHAQEEVGPLGAQPLPRLLEPAAFDAADFIAFDHPGAPSLCGGRRWLPQPAQAGQAPRATAGPRRRRPSRCAATARRQVDAADRYTGGARGGRRTLAL